MTDKPRRRILFKDEYALPDSHETVDMLEVRPTDPADLDELIAAAREVLDNAHPLEYGRLRKALEGSDE